MRFRPIVVAVTVIGLASLVAACADDFDLDKLDVFHLNEKKKLPGKREELFPGGVPGVSNGVPPELVEGYKPADEAAASPPGEPKPAVAEKPKAKPKPKVARRAPTKVTVQPKKQQPAQQQQQQQAQDPAWQNAPAPQPAAQSPWPASQPAQAGTNAPWPSAPQQPSAWPTAPAPGTFQKQ